MQKKQTATTGHIFEFEMRCQPAVCIVTNAALQEAGFGHLENKQGNAVMLLGNGRTVNLPSGHISRKRK